MGGSGSKSSNADSANGGSSNPNSLLGKDDPRDESKERFKQEMIKVIVVGQSAGGKTKLIQRLVHNTFKNRPTDTMKQAMRYRATTTVKVSMLDAPCPDGDRLFFELWDQPSDSAIDISKMFYAHSDAVLLCVNMEDGLIKDKIDVIVSNLCTRLGISIVTNTDEPPADDTSASARVAAVLGAAKANQSGKNGTTAKDTLTTSLISPPYETMSVPVILVGTKSDGRTRVTKKDLRKMAKANGMYGPFVVSSLRNEGSESIVKCLRQYFQKNPKYYKTREEAYQKGLEAAQEILGKSSKDTGDKGAGEDEDGGSKEKGKKNDDKNDKKTDKKSEEKDEGKDDNIGQEKKKEDVKDTDKKEESENKDGNDKYNSSNGKGKDKKNATEIEEPDEPESREKENDDKKEADGGKKDNGEDKKDNNEDKDKKDNDEDKDKKDNDEDKVKKDNDEDKDKKDNNEVKHEGDDGQ